MVSVVSQAISMNRVPEISAVGYDGTFSYSNGSFSQNAGAAGSFTLTQSSEPYQKFVVLTRIVKASGLTISNLALSVQGSTGLNIAEISNSTNNLYMHYINHPRTNGAFSSYNISLTGLVGQTPGSISLVSRVYILDGGSGPQDVQTNTNSASHVLGAEDFINDKAAIFAITSGASITGITTQATSPTTGAEVFTSGSTVNLSTTGIMISAVFK
jgi:hypothetical protein